MTFEQLLTSPVQTLSRVASRLALKLPRTPSAVARELEAFVDANERHQRAAVGNKRADPSGVAILNRELYETIARVAETGEGWDRVRRVAAAACERIERQRYYLLALANGVARYRHGEAELRSTIALVSQERDEAIAQVESLKRQLAFTRERLHRDARARIGLAQRLRTELESVKCELEASQRHLDLVTQSISWRLTAPLRWARWAAGRVVGWKKVTREGIPSRARQSQSREAIVSLTDHEP